MTHCSSCSAPLKKNSITCPYCGCINNIDLVQISEHTEKKPHSQRFCPQCKTELESLNIGKSAPFWIERCATCMGLFFDNNELETILNDSVTNVYRTDLHLIDSLNNSASHSKVVKYRYCPVCKEMMQRRLYAHRSGVIIDQCTNHGIWLDGGELRKLLEWKKAGGEILHEKYESDKMSAEAAQILFKNRRSDESLQLEYQIDVDGAIDRVLGIIKLLFR